MAQVDDRLDCFKVHNLLARYFKVQDVKIWYNVCKTDQIVVIR